ncbi:hypothetical protein OEA41_000487 [Lepraria neglecta]|uniref:Cytochrome P450 n=1 Tax=Lepraria neglecta TaxID=209136 RepID=A0AAD9ZIM8_9LECA|nr:hypothetical protein OEA41_000487 [Lepraria neglecta]
MLQGGGRKNTNNRKFVGQRMMNVPGRMDLYAKSFDETTRKILATQAWQYIPIRKNGRIGGLIGNFFAAAPTPKGSLKEIRQKLTQDLLGAGYRVNATAKSLFTTAAGGIANIPSTSVSILDWFLKPEISQHWAAVQKLSAKDPGFVRDLEQICEAARVKADQGSMVTLRKGEVALCNLIATFRDPSVYPAPDQVKLDRPMDVHQMWSMGPHGCVGRAIAITALASMVKVYAQIKYLRRAPGDQGRIKYVLGPLPGSRKYLSDGLESVPAFRSK